MLYGYYKDGKGKIIDVIAVGTEVGSKRQIAVYWEDGVRRACAVSVLKKRKLVKYDPGPVIEMMGT